MVGSPAAVFLLTKPDRKQIDRFLAAQRNRTFSYREVGASRRLAPTLSISPNAPEAAATTTNGAIRFASGRYAESRIDPEGNEVVSVDALALLANAYVSAGDPGQAAVAWAALARVSRDAAAYFQLSESFVEFGRRVLGRSAIGGCGALALE